MNNLKAIRLAKGITQSKIASELNISRQAYYNYETGKREADYETLLKLGEILGVSVEELIRDDTGDVYETYKKFISIKQKNAPDDEVRSEIISIVNQLSDSQAEKLRDFLKGMISE